MDPNTVVLEISSDEDVDWNENVRRSSDGGGGGGGDDGDDHNWLTELLGDENKEVYGDDSDEVVVMVSESEKPVKKPELKSSVVDFEDDDDCVVLDKDPNAPAEVRNDNSGNGDDVDSDDIVVVSEKGQVACRDYPHSRHLCIKYPFSSTPNQSHCDQCYCYVCDSLAPCVYWGNGSASTNHCHATDKDEFWILERKNAKTGGKVVQPVSKLPMVDLYTPAQVMVHSQNQISKSGPIHANHTSANFRSPSVISQVRNNILAYQQRHNTNARLVHRVHRPVFKTTVPVRVATTAHRNPHSSVPVRVATTAHRNPHSSYMGDLGIPIRHRNYQLTRKHLGSLQPNGLLNTSVPYPPQSQTYTSSTVNQPQPQLCHLPNPNFQSFVNVNFNTIPETPIQHQLCDVLPSSSRLQPPSNQLTHTVPVQPSYHVPLKSQVDSPLVPVSDFTLNNSQGNQSQGPIVDSGIKDTGLGFPTGQDSVTPEGAGSAANKSSLAAVTGSLADYQFDWIFDNQHIEPGFTDYSSDSAFIDTGPIFDF